ncbi:Hypothetical protein R9X50_00715600 [Acrodontium crateriforme]|uniref:SRPBCC family protein n=1 Tax=Acrodontium crateriforme TaxID=150365 RepID=A0AAQ3MB13_9PEZI|nr:Hypothetical protein R9X50_00715600 [Acrodontium crateriforme]
MDLNTTFPGDDIIPDAVMIYNQLRVVRAPRSEVYPWILQLGKGRGGWYLPASWERFLPKTWWASRTIEDRWQHLKVGDRVDDYGFDAKEDYFDVVTVDSPNALIYRSDRYGAKFTWSLLLHERTTESGPETTIHLRFRGKIAARGLKRKLLVWGGEWMDWASTTPMLAGLAERVERQKTK